ncbi:hypothetical protein WICPIJ_000442 [Wickerhamomyces pijperi]|uniref:20S-pre-rRNA D-site endonuclease NOB1 n=1 Tax=Wickerhamomyces pijperi TaxID=599730 RepID=A0A9P8TRT7_WICPI|nr:hypothetical protein WICPIJ_000442 [Wickerhamomyces pijperi]
MSEPITTVAAEQQQQQQVPKFAPKVQTLVLDATPLITQHISTLQNYATQFYTVPTVYNEIKDENARRNLALWGDKLRIRHPKKESIDRVTEFSRMTGDYAVLSANDIHIIALTYELECEENGGDWRLRKKPGEKLTYQRPGEAPKEQIKQEEETTEPKVEEPQQEQEQETTDTKKKPRRRGGKKQREKREAEARLLAEQAATEESTEQSEPQATEEEVKEISAKLEAQTLNQQEQEPEAASEAELTEEYNESDDDGDWITEDNLLQEMIKDSGEQITNSNSASQTKIKVALATSDFACQNTSLQLGLNLMNTLSGLQIKRIRNYMLRCHACFTMLPIPKSGQPKHFCPRCGGMTLLRCAVSVDSQTGKIQAHLKANFEWHTRGDRYSLASPLSKNSQKRFGNKGFVHNKSNKQKEYNEPILNEDQKEYAKAIKDEEWLRRKNEKVLNDYIGGGSADNFISPFVAQGYRTGVGAGGGVKVGKGRFINSARRKNK